MSSLMLTLAVSHAGCSSGGSESSLVQVSEALVRPLSSELEGPPTNITFVNDSNNDHNENRTVSVTETTVNINY